MSLKPLPPVQAKPQVDSGSGVAVPSAWPSRPCALSPAISLLPQLTEAGCEEVVTGRGPPGGLFPPVRSSPAHPPVGEATVLVSTSPRQVSTLLPCQDDIRSLSRDLTQASVLGTCLLLSREPKCQQRQSAWIPFPATAKPRTGVVLACDQTENLDSTCGHAHPRSYSSCGPTSACKVHPFLLSPPLGVESCPIFGLYHIQCRWRCE